MKSTDILRVENLRNIEKKYVIQWQVTYLCNYSCDFCVQGNEEFHNQQAKKESAQIRETICRKLISLIEEELNGKAERVQIILLGGEVTIMKDFIPIISRLLEAKFDGLLEIHITTNLSMDIRTCRTLSTVLRGKKNRKLTMSFSYYKDFANEKEFFKKVQILTGRSIRREILKKFFHHANGFQCTIGYPLCQDEDYEQYMQFRRKHAKYADLMKEIVIRDYKTLISKDVKEKLRRMKKPKKNIRVIFKDGKIEYLGHNLDIGLFLDEEVCFQPQGFLCDSGVRFIVIDPQGNMSRCITAAKDTVFGNICTDPPRFLGDKMRCPAKRCACSYYSLIENDLG